MMIYIFFLFLNILNKYSGMFGDTYNERKELWIQKNMEEAKTKEDQENKEVQRREYEVQMRREAEKKKAQMLEVSYERRKDSLLSTINSHGVQEETMIRLRTLWPSQLETIIDGDDINIAIQEMLESIATEEAKKKAMIARMVGLG